MFFLEKPRLSPPKISPPPSKSQKNVVHSHCSSSSTASALSPKPSSKIVQMKLNKHSRYFYVSAVGTLHYSALFCILFAVFYICLGIYAYDSMFFATSETHNDCKSLSYQSSPSNIVSYATCPDVANVTFEEYNVPRENWTEVWFESREACDDAPCKLHGYLLMNKENPKAPLVIVAHGLRVCKRIFSVLLPSSILWRNGFHVLALDLRNHGESESDHSEPYATFGWKESLDIMGAVDFITTKVPALGHLTKSNSSIGLVGCSMAGATSIITLSMDDRVNTAFVDAPACDPLATMIYNADQMSAGLGGFVVSAACFVINHLPFLRPKSSTIGCPPFPYHPMHAAKKLGPKKNIYVQHPKDDLLVPFHVVEKCVKNMIKSGAHVTTYFVDRIGHNDPKRGICEMHCQIPLYDIKGYERRLVEFFKSTLLQS